MFEMFPIINSIVTAHRVCNDDRKQLKKRWERNESQCNDSTNVQNDEQQNHNDNEANQTKNE